MVRLAELRVAEVDAVTCHVNGEYLPRAIARRLVPDGKARQDDATVFGLLLLAHEIIVPAHSLDHMRQCKQRFTVEIAKHAAPRELLDKCMEGNRLGPARSVLDGSALSLGTRPNRPMMVYSIAHLTPCLCLIRTYQN